MWFRCLNFMLSVFFTLLLGANTAFLFVLSHCKFWESKVWFWIFKINIFARFSYILQLKTLLAFTKYFSLYFLWSSPSTDEFLITLSIYIFTDLADFTDNLGLMNDFLSPQNLISDLSQDIVVSLIMNSWSITLLVELKFILNQLFWKKNEIVLDLCL